MKSKWAIVIGVVVVAFFALLYRGIFHGAAAEVAKAALLKDPGVMERCGTDIEVEPAFSGAVTCVPVAAGWERPEFALVVAAAKGPRRLQ